MRAAEQLTGDYGDDGVQALLGWAPDGTIHYIAESRLESWDGRHPPQVLAALPEQAYTIGQAQYLSAEKLLYTVGAGTRLWDLGDKSVHRRPARLWLATVRTVRRPGNARDLRGERLRETCGNCDPMTPRSRSAGMT